jgi:hypothetical protein
MEIVMLRLGDMDFRLRAGVKLRKLEKRIVAAVRRGGGVVKLPVEGGAAIEAVISAATPITVERREAEPAVDPRDAREPQFDCGDEFRRAG